MQSYACTPGNRQQVFLAACAFLLLMPLFLTGISRSADAQEPPTPMTLREAVESAIGANLDLQTTRREIEAARANRNVQKSNLLPTLTSNYAYTRNSGGTGGGFTAGFAPTIRNEYDFSVGFTQPIFQGFSLINSYRVAELGVDIAELNQKFTRLDVIFQIKQAYFNVLKAQKLVTVAEDSVMVLEAQVEVARNFYEVGLTPLNDLLQVQVQLANARQQLIVASNNLNVAESQFNVILRRPVNAPVAILDIIAYTPLAKDLDDYLQLAERNRLDIKIADLNIQVAEKELEIARKDYYPSVALEGVYFKRAENWTLSDDENFFDPDGWSITGTATWNFWEWGRTKFGVSEKRSRLSQARIGREQALDRIRLEVESSYLKAKESEKNISAVEQAVEQAQENMRITEERYKEQVATSTDILIAQNLLTQTRTNYFNALYDFKIAEAFLQKAVSLEILE